MANKANVTTPAVAVETIVKSGVKSVQVYSNGDSSMRYRVTLDVTLEAMKKNYETDDYELADVDYIDFVPRVLIAQCINLVDGLDLMYTKKKENALKNENASGFGAAELQVILRGAKLEIKRTKFEIGSEYTDSNGDVQTHENAGFNTDIVKIKVSDKVQGKLDDLIDSVFDI